MNTIFIVSAKDPSSQWDVDLYSKYSIAAWDSYCKKYGQNLVVMRELPPQFHKAKWIKCLAHHYICDGWIAIVDADTMPAPHCPNIFSGLEENSIYATQDGNIDWIKNSIAHYQPYFPKTQISPIGYFNSGVLLVHSYNVSYLKSISKFYQRHRKTLEKDKTPCVGSDQTILNYLASPHKVKLLSAAYNNFQQLTEEYHRLYKQQAFTEDYLDWQFPKNSYIWHFTGFPIEHRIRMMHMMWDIHKKLYD